MFHNTGGFLASLAVGRMDEVGANSVWRGGGVTPDGRLLERDFGRR
jgi:hypothetical protein